MPSLFTNGASAERGGGGGPAAARSPSRISGNSTACIGDDAAAPREQAVGQKWGCHCESGLIDATPDALRYMLLLLPSLILRIEAAQTRSDLRDFKPIGVNPTLHCIEGGHHHIAFKTSEM